MIRTLSKTNQYTNTVYISVLIGLAVVSTVLYVPTLRYRSTTLLSTLSITSLLSTAFLLCYLPVNSTGIALLERRTGESISSSGRVKAPGALFKTGAWDQSKPLLKYLPYLNLILCLLLGVLGFLLRAKGGRQMWMGFEYVPGMLYGFALSAKIIMASVDVEQDLGSLRYGLKGA